MSAVNLQIPHPGHAAALDSLPLSTVVRMPAPRRQKAPGLIRARREQAIHDAAYYHWAYRGCRAGGELDDWLAAEREVDEQLAMRDALIQQAAYARWLKRGRLHGQDVKDWLAAEQEVDASLARRGLLSAL